MRAKHGDVVDSPSAIKGRTFSADFRLTFLANGHERPSKPKKVYRNPVALAQEWQWLLDCGAVTSRADLARQLGFFKAHVTQVLSLLRLVPEVSEAVLALGNPLEGRIVGAHTLRSLAKLPAEEQRRRVKRFLSQRGGCQRFKNCLE